METRNAARRMRRIGRRDVGDWESLDAVNDGKFFKCDLRKIS